LNGNAIEFLPSFPTPLLCQAEENYHHCNHQNNVNGITSLLIPLEISGSSDTDGERGIEDGQDYFNRTPRRKVVNSGILPLHSQILTTLPSFTPTQQENDGDGNSDIDRVKYSYDSNPDPPSAHSFHPDTFNFQTPQFLMGQHIHLFGQYVPSYVQQHNQDVCQLQQLSYGNNVGLQFGNFSPYYENQMQLPVFMGNYGVLESSKGGEREVV
jgi:hypothetical protein